MEWSLGKPRACARVVLIYDRVKYIHAVPLGQARLLSPPRGWPLRGYRSHSLGLDLEPRQRNIQQLGELLPAHNQSVTRQSVKNVN